ncbi:hypothetical protein AADZ86_06750 [Colwelliaceae bacterium BS250]
MNIKKSFWKISTLLVVVFFLLKPEFIMLGLFIDGIGLELFLLLLEVQFVAIALQYFKPVLQSIYRFIAKIDPYFFIPSKAVVVRFPAMFCHAIPGFMVMYFFVLVNKFGTGVEYS